MPRFSIRQLLMATALVAFGCLALVKSSSLVAAAMMGTVALALIAAVVLAIYRAGDRRAFWLGFAIFGWSYLLLCYGSIFNQNNSPIGWNRIVTGQLATSLYDRIYPSVQPTIPGLGTVRFDFRFSAPPPSAAYDPAALGLNGIAPPRTAATGPNPVDFLNVAHSLWAVLIACAGGWFGRWASSSRLKAA